MDTGRLDRLARLLAQRTTRRGAAPLTLLPWLGALLAALDPDEGAAKRKRHGRRHSHRPGKDRDNRKGKRKRRGMGAPLPECETGDKGQYHACGKNIGFRCPGGEYCRACPVPTTKNGTCVTAPSCTTGADCPQWASICADGSCAPRCMAFGGICLASEVCINGGCVDKCDQGNCFGGGNCQNGACIRTCTNHADCGVNQFCSGGVCGSPAVFT